MNRRHIMWTMKSTALILVLYTTYSTSVVQVSYAQEEAHHLRGGGARLITPRYFYSRLIFEEKKIATVTNDCRVGVTLSCPTTPEVMTLDNDCFDPFQVITFRYNSGDCHQSENLQNRHDFTCTDLNTSSSGGGPILPSSAGSSNSSYIVVTSNSGNETYFTGSVAVGEEYTVNANEGDDQLIADLTITIFETEGGNRIQTTALRLDCTNPLFLFDRFGASQVTAWKEISGRVVTIPDVTTRMGIIALTVDNPGPAPIQLVEMTLLSNIEDTPITYYTSEVNDTVLQPTDELSLTNYQFEYDLATVPTRYIFFTTIIAEQLADGDTTNRQCNSFHTIECLL
mmetsp:Transcript_42787/g.43523  ORF Transcript_42787/g.43523 Transcript_42787/m.43523 type:complete len:341 (-) Transcript_42787:68-1090(-)